MDFSYKKALSAPMETWTLAHGRLFDWVRVALGSCTDAIADRII